VGIEPQPDTEAAAVSGLPANARRVPVTIALCIGAIVMSCAVWYSIGLDPVVIDGRAFRTEPWRIFSAPLVHADWRHLVGNLYWTWRLGTALERRLGHTCLAILVLLLAIGVGSICHAFDEGPI
jgi:membrane associated rhomboid family serine protease